MESRLRVEPVTDALRPMLGGFFRVRWESHIVISRGVAYEAALLPGFLVYRGDEFVGAATYHTLGDQCELLTIDSTVEGIGVGTLLIQAVRGAAKALGCVRLWLITSNDNLNALRFYQKRGFQIVAVYPNAIDRSRELKPEIPLIGEHGIPLRDELELEMRL